MDPPFPCPTKKWHNAPYPAVSPSRPELSLAGKSAIVTGAGGPIGAAIARALVEAGVKYVALVGRRVELLETIKKQIASIFEGKTHVEIFSVDISDRPSIEKVMSSIKEGTGAPVDILIHSAAFLPDLAPVTEAKQDDWWTGFSTNVLGTFILTQEFLKVAPASATIINVSTGMVHVPTAYGLQGCSGYGPSKAATAKLFEWLQTETPSLRVFSFHPGVVAGEMNTKAKMFHLPYDDANLPAQFTVWLCSPEADFLKGRFVWSSWDVDELKAMKAKVEGSSLFTLTLDGWPFVDGFDRSIPVAE